MQQSFVTTVPTRPGYSKDLDFSLCKARVYAQHCRDISMVKALLKSWQLNMKWAAPSEFGTYHLCEQRRFRRACASAQSRQNLRCSLIQAVSQEEPSNGKPDPWPL